MSEYTSGPWRAGMYLSNFDWYVCLTSKHGDGNNIVDRVNGLDSDERLANARLIAAAPDMLEALKALLELFTAPEETALDTFERIGEAFYIETGMLRPGKSEPPECDYEGRTEERRAAFDAWISGRLETARAAIAKAEAHNVPGR